MRRPWRLPLLAAALLATACAPADTADETAQTTDALPVPADAQADAIVASVSNYELTMDRMRRWMTAAANLGRAAERDPSIGEPPDAEGQSLESMIAWYERTPAAREALRSAGISSRDFVMTTLAYMQAGMTDAMMSQYQAAEPPPGQNMRNVEFVRRHRAELEQLARQTGLDQRGGSGSSDDDTDY